MKRPTSNGMKYAFWKMFDVALTALPMIIGFVFVFACGFGWIMNIGNLVDTLMTNEPLIEVVSGMTILQFIGIFFFPLGIIMGLII